MIFEHVTHDGIREYERPQMDIGHEIPKCEDHGVEMKLRKLVEVSPPKENLLFKCPVDDCDATRWLS